MHACISTIQEQFSITIQNDNDIYQPLKEMFSTDLKSQSEGRFSDIDKGYNKSESMLVPFWSWQTKCEQVYELLSNNREDLSIQFKLDLIKDCLELSHCYVSYKSISIIPFCTHIQKISSFDEAKRRIYMSATLPDDSPFAAVMGLDLQNGVRVIAPEKANDIGERLIVVPKVVNGDIDDYELRNAISKQASKYNVVVLTPSGVVAKQWEDFGGQLFEAANISDGIKSIKNSTNGLYVFKNRYDGIDLPDDACRIIVIDGLPNISNLNDKYEEEVVRKSERINREQIQRIEQGMGRGVRSSNDYCLVYLLGNQLTNVLYTDDGYKFFSKATEAQFKLSEKLCDQLGKGSLEDIIEVGNCLLERNENWIELCKAATSSIEYDKELNVSKDALSLRNAFDVAFKKDYQNASGIITSIVNDCSFPRLKGYYKQLLAEYTNFYDSVVAQQIQKSAKIENPELLSPVEGIQFSKELDDICNQSQMIVDYISNNKLDSNKIVMLTDSILGKLEFREGTSRQFENAIKEVFELIGYKAIKPERKYGKGPDDFVNLGDGLYLVIECKNETVTSTICKRDCNQLIGSESWFYTNYQDTGFKCTPIMIHNSDVFNYDCSPRPETRIMTPTLLNKFKSIVRKCMVEISQPQHINNVIDINSIICSYKLDNSSIVTEFTTGFKVNK